MNMDKLIAAEQLEDTEQRLIRCQEYNRQLVSGEYAMLPYEATDDEIAQAIIAAFPSRYGYITAKLAAHIVALRTGAKRDPTLRDICVNDFVVEE